MLALTGSFALVCGLAGCQPALLIDSENNDSKHKVSEEIWNDDKAQMNLFIDALMNKMTLEEKIGQMTLVASDWDVTGPTMRESYKEDIRAGNVGAILNAHTAKYTRELQKIVVEETRLGIPLLFGYDVIHGYKTIFPIPLGEAASWDLEAIKNSAEIAAAEAAASGIHWTYAPMVDLSRDPRWGRVSEGAGEDVYLNTEVARARVKGFQGDDLAKANTVLACVKHYAAYGQAQAGRDYHTTDMSMRELFDTYLPPFKAAVDAGVTSLMTSFNALNGIPSTGNEFLLNDILRKKWGFEGFVVSDYTSINEMVPHGFARDEKHAGKLAVNAGVDMDMQGAVFQNYLEELVMESKVQVAQINLAARRILEMKYRLGLFEDPYRYSDEERDKTEIHKPQYLEAARDMARKSIVLLRNRNQVLPIRKRNISLAVIGPLANSKEDMIGSWSAAGDRYQKPVTLLEGIKTKVAKARDAEIHYAKGASYELKSEDQSGFAEAIGIARKSDVIVMAMGEKWDMTGEAASRTSLDLPGSQEALMRELKKLGKPMVLVLMSGRPMTIAWADENIDAILETWYGGTMAGHAIADVLFGDYNPSGKLPVTFPRTVGQVPIYYNMKNTGRPYDPMEPKERNRSRYLATPNSPLYPFGYGLSYTSFSYSEISLDNSELDAAGELIASVEVTNSGDYDGEEIVQLYIRDLVGSVTRPVQELKRFKKVFLKKGESTTVIFRLKPSDLAFHRKDMSYGAEAGAFKLFIGTSSENVQEADFSLTESVAM